MPRSVKRSRGAPAARGGRGGGADRASNRARGSIASVKPRPDIERQINRPDRASNRAPLERQTARIPRGPL